MERPAMKKPRENMAGINAALKIQRAEFILKRSEAYIGVLIDDLVGNQQMKPI